ncbi:hypothetical protein ACWFR1_21860 [Streptomyces sp. NPDC055103]
MTSHHIVPSEEDLHFLTRSLLVCFNKLDDLKSQRGTAAERLPDTVRIGGALHQTSLYVGKLLAQTALSDAGTTVDGREAVVVLRRLTTHTANSAIWAADCVSSLVHDDTISADRQLEWTRAHLAKTPVMVQDVSAALLRHDGYLYAQERATRENLDTSGPAVKVSQAQRKGLASLARGDAVVRGSTAGTREVATPLAAHMRATTIDALADKKLITLTPLAQQDRYGVRLTSDGVQALLSARPAQHSHPASVTPAPTTAKSAVRSAGAARR